MEKEEADDAVDKSEEKLKWSVSTSDWKSSQDELVLSKSVVRETSPPPDFFFSNILEAAEKGTSWQELSKTEQKTKKKSSPDILSFW